MNDECSDKDKEDSWEPSEYDLERWEEAVRIQGEILRMRTAAAVLANLRHIYAMVEGRFDKEDKLAKQKIFLFRIFRPLIIMTTDPQGTSDTVREADFIESERKKLFFDRDKSIAYPSPTLWVWNSEDRAVCKSLSANQRSMPTLMADIMRFFRSELQKEIDAQEDLRLYLRVLTNEELDEKIDHFQMHDHSYFESLYAQLTEDQEAEQIQRAQEAFIYHQRVLLQHDMHAYHRAVARRGMRSGRAEAEIERAIRQHAPDLLSMWRHVLSNIEGEQPERS